jgi:hypothetical protein
MKNRLITLYDGNLEIARDLSLDEIIDHIAFRLKTSAISTGRLSSCIKQTNRAPQIFDESPIKHVD